MQIVGYRSGESHDEDASLLIAADGSVKNEPLTQGHELSFTLGTRRCAGVLDEDTHVSCREATAPYCDRHRSRWPCARCTGGCDRPIEACREEHAVYLAAFAPDVFKVGVTRSWRVRTRLREQGADRAAHIQTVVDGRVARELEAEIASEIQDRVRVPTKIRGLHQSVNEPAWRALLEQFDPIETFDFDYGFTLSSCPVPETIASGTVRGTKGRILVLERPSGTYAVDLRDLVGFEADNGQPDRDLQSNLGVF